MITTRESVKDLVQFKGHTAQEIQLENLTAAAGAELQMLPRVRGGVIEPSLVVLAKKYNQEKKVCRMCAPHRCWRRVACLVWAHTFFNPNIFLLRNIFQISH